MLSGLPVFADLGETVAPVNVNSAVSTAASPLDTVASEAKSAILIEANTRTVLYEKDADMALPPASVTKVMTMLLVMEAIDSGKISLEDTVTVSAYASKMGGSQVYLEEGEQMSVHELLKCVVVASANDACVALAEHIAGSEEAFVSMMNARARELKMEHTNFENTNGLDDDTKNHVISARDIATMSAELIINHPKILEYSSIWMDSIRGGAFGLTNTNRLIRFYNGANGLKTGSTSKAKFCISASAKRGNTQLICVVMGAPTPRKWAARRSTSRKVSRCPFMSC
jgi:D-alanyl-D-alanine carboxypeptidase (penicillin-binding protein 5/6)